LVAKRNDTESPRGARFLSNFKTFINSVDDDEKELINKLHVILFYAQMTHLEHAGPRKKGKKRQPTDLFGVKRIFSVNIPQKESETVVFIVQHPPTSFSFHLIFLLN
jgi:hypothetical protein